MTKASGHYLSLSPYRKIVLDLMHFSAKIPIATVERKMSLSSVKIARQMSPDKPSWTSIFAKGYGLVARDFPELRRSFMSFPWPKFYEHPHSIASINVERVVNNENVVIYGYVRAPENRTLIEIDDIIRHHKDDPIEEVRSYTRTRWWYTLNVEGPRRCHNFGTFAISSVSSMGAGLLNLMPILTTQIHYGMLDKEGNLDVRLTFDHRVLDGATAARALVALEDVMKSTLVREMNSEKRMAA
ncbi:MAG: hypothetical protein NTZ30_12860 [Planctomycetota bacterium]|nr:hypothetical protein [Planctomycetota bacterium]